MDVAAADAADRGTARGTDAGQDSRPLVITVHGTFAHDVGDDGEQWWQRGSLFTSVLAERLAEKGFPDVALQPFHWSGLNSDQARLRAAAALAGTIATTKRNGRPVAVLAHSHGGNVLMEALVQRRTRRPLAAALTLGTPFFTRRLKPLPTLIATFKVLLGLAVAPAMLMYAWLALPTAFDGQPHRADRPATAHSRRSSMGIRVRRAIADAPAACQGASAHGDRSRALAGHPESARRGDAPA
jgi:hypothetical protein